MTVVIVTYRYGVGEIVSASLGTAPLLMHGSRGCCGWRQLYALTMYSEVDEYMIILYEQNMRARCVS